ncbi:MAG: hypothetical protein G01um101416_112 [Microgenomates group bacterium Gr01-1014_16]|nr:MAG: hypothetical protein G01um101416_112 [Microgenomates group bacterium Gr01-1014_16]
MRWTRKFFNQFEWLHKPISPLEESFLLPLQINKSGSLISERLGLKLPDKYWSIIDGYLYFSDEYWKLFLQLGTLQLPKRIKTEIDISSKRWITKVLPEYQKEINKLNKLSLNELSVKKLLELFKKTGELESWFFSESLYVGVVCGITELLFKYSYPLFVKDSDNNNYRELLLGYPDKGIDMDTQLWEVAQISDEQKKQLQLGKWIEKYGYRIQDKDLIYPTLGEETELLNSYLKLYRETLNPKLKLMLTNEKRINREKFVKQNARFRIRLFEWILNQAQNYSQIRNSRPFYYQGNSIMRKILFSIKLKANFPQDKNDIFYITMKELEEVVSNKFSKESLQKIINERKQTYYKQLLIEPQFSIEA